ncbi:uncharacterized protein RSE6_04018 [Rhynchosporium secalis]|uniref:Zn(2)-C6 fungal-type domain-containing protein n=1 Tax=Rhynchosporium secalis TaxID=38038 RepID=A0A1E1M475_RHYSE|nr:uncharacterized protein RSE6_04018 [Rhynchosporium secalis]
MDQNKLAMASLITPPSENNEVFADMKENKLAISAPMTPPAEDSEDEEADDFEPMSFNFDGPQTDPENQNHALQEYFSPNARSQSVSSLQNESPEEPITFNFGPQPLPAPEADFIASFTAGGSKKNHMPLGIRELAASINNRRRAATNREFRGAASAYIDEDESGTYDPRTARRTPHSPARPTKRVKTSEGRTPRSRKPAKQIGFRYSLVVKLQLNSKKGLKYLSSIPAGPSITTGAYHFHSSTPDEEYDSDDSSYVVKSKRKRAIKPPARLGAMYSRSDGLTIASLTPGHPQRRGCNCCFEQDNDGCSLIEHPDEYPCESCDDAGTDCVFIIPPAYKKSCLRCKDKRRNCSYVLDGGKGVEKCDACEEEAGVCCAEPMTEQNVIRRFAKLPVRSKLKQAPEVQGKNPISGKDAVKERLYVSCSQCRDTGKRCTIRGKENQGPCSGCSKSGHACEFIDKKTKKTYLGAVFTPRVRKSSTFSLSTYAHSADEETDTIPDRLGTPHSPTTLTATLYSEIGRKNTRKAQKLIAQGKLFSPSHPLHSIQPRRKSSTTSRFNIISPKLLGRTLALSHVIITTSFCHPITFNYIPDPMNTHPCSWCDNPFFGLWGLASEKLPRKVEGYFLPTSEGGGFEEIYGGWSDLGFQRSVMCVRCTYARVRITTCQSHRLRLLDVNKGEQDLRIFDDMAWEEAAEALTRGDQEGGRLVSETKWCSICPSPAALKCCAPQLFDEDGEAVQQSGFGRGARDKGHGCGCGLLLCQECADLLGKVIKGGAWTGAEQLDAIVREVKRNIWIYNEGARADAEFLTSGGELFRRMGGGIGAGDDGGEREVDRVNGAGRWTGEEPWDVTGGRRGEMKMKMENQGRGWMDDEDLGIVKDRNGKGKVKFEVSEDDGLFSTFTSREKEASRTFMAIDSKGKENMVPTSSRSGSRFKNFSSDKERQSTDESRFGSSSFSASASNSFSSTSSTSNSRHNSDYHPNDRRASQPSNDIPQRPHHQKSNVKEESRSMAPPPASALANSWNGVGGSSMYSSRGAERERGMKMDRGGANIFGGKMGEEFIDMSEE